MYRINIEIFTASNKKKKNNYSKLRILDTEPEECCNVPKSVLYLSYLATISLITRLEIRLLTPSANVDL